MRADYWSWAQINLKGFSAVDGLIFRRSDTLGSFFFYSLYAQNGQTRLNLLFSLAGT
jgi:hypothetical protein